jgi:hypothetical protein
MSLFDVSNFAVSSPKESNSTVVVRLKPTITVIVMQFPAHIAYGRSLLLRNARHAEVSQSLDPDDYELFEEGYDSDDYEEEVLTAIANRLCII